MGDVIIRATEPADIDGLAALTNLPGYRFGTLRLPFESVESVRRRVRLDDPDVTSLVAETEGRIVGSLGLVRQRGRRAHVASIGMGVHDDFTGRGIARRLLGAAVDLADNWLGLVRLELTVNVDNTAAIHLYESFGFEREGVERRSILREGVFVDSYRMARLRDGVGPQSRARS